MKFSVLMSVYKGDDPAFLEEALESIWDGQHLKPDEIVLVNDGPIPLELEASIQRFGKRAPLKRVPLKENVGLGMALAEGLKSCSHEWIARMDSDDLSHPDRFAKQVAFIQGNPQVDVLGTYIEEFADAPDNTIAIRAVPENNRDIMRVLRFRNAMNHVSVFMRKARILEAGSYQSMIYFEDYYLWARMALAGARFHNLPEPLVRVRVGEAMIGRRKGRDYVRKELAFFRSLVRIGFIGKARYIKALLIRVPLRFLPGGLLTFVYKNLARSR